MEENLPQNNSIIIVKTWHKETILSSQDDVIEWGSRKKECIHVRNG